METEYNGLHSLPPDFLLLIPNCSYVLSENESEPFREPQEYEKGRRVRSWSRPLIICPVLRALNPALLFPVAVGVGPVLVLQKQTKKKIRKVARFPEELQTSLGYAVRRPGPNITCVLVPPLKWWAWNRVCLLSAYFLLFWVFFSSCYNDVLSCPVFPPPVCSLNLITIMCLDCF